ncbi:hypothetical protein Tco_0824798 [Tanacetum coccineum]
MLFQNPGIQIVENMNGLSVVLEIANQYGNGNVVTAPAEGNGNGINGNPISNSCRLLRGMKSGSKTQEEFEFMAAADAYKETKRVKVNCTSENTLQQASTSGTQFDNAPVYDSDGSTEISYDKAYNDMQQKIERLQAQLGDLKVDKMNCLSKPVTSNSAPSTRESKVVQTVNVIAPRIFRINPSKTSRVDNVVPNKPVNNTAKTRRPHPRSNSNTDRVPSKSKSSCLSNNVEKIEENHRNSQIPKNQKHMSSECNNITLAIRNAKSEIVCVMCKQCLVTANHDVCVLNYVNDMNSHADNQSANVSIRENQKKHKENVKKLKELGSKGSLASSRPRKPRTYLRWIPTGRIFAMCGKLTASSNTENKSKKYVCENASTSLNGQKQQRIDLSADQASNLNVKRRLNKRFKPRTTMSTKVSTADMIIMTSMIELESLFDSLFNEYFNGENQVFSNSSDVTTADASDNRQQQPDSTSSTSTLATSVTADGNFDL